MEDSRVTRERIPSVAQERADRALSFEAFAGDEIAEGPRLDRDVGANDPLLAPQTTQFLRDCGYGSSLLSVAANLGQNLLFVEPEERFLARTDLMDAAV